MRVCVVSIIQAEIRNKRHDACLTHCGDVCNHEGVLEISIEMKRNTGVAAIHTDRDMKSVGFIILMDTVCDDEAGWVCAIESLKNREECAPTGGVAPWRKFRKDIGKDAGIGSVEGVWGKRSVHLILVYIGSRVVGRWRASIFYPQAA